ncbi:MAG TPA: hypothetical protein VH637_13945 [Streptosporangiaceae bacterium]|jgi:hypothetical protein
MFAFVAEIAGWACIALGLMGILDFLPGMLSPGSGRHEPARSGGWHKHGRDLVNDLWRIATGVSMLSILWWDHGAGRWLTSVPIFALGAGEAWWWLRSRIGGGSDGEAAEPS